ncbi:BPSL0067 family protein [Burkholderia oklahomensis]|uniref:BPSL0067 family protein n=1 Tax=Burkholderia oklahomensis TaxID=342113 RepID=UPI002652D2DD|nr:BPSL0067 family protein [Burkholderia oklahomensis]MDN7674078.1 BPSL0067 family protein [Burkholderia oklahomensis]
MPYVSTHYLNNPNAPVGKWTCAPTSNLGPFDTAPSGRNTSGRDLCGQCVSYVKRVCLTLPMTVQWRKGAQVKGGTSIVPGTVIATFNAAGKYEGHAAIYVSQSAAGILVYDQFVTPPSPQPVKQRLLRWGAHGRSNNGDNFHVVE